MISPLQLIARGGFKLNRNIIGIFFCLEIFQKQKKHKKLIKQFFATKNGNLNEPKLTLNQRARKPKIQILELKIVTFPENIVLKKKKNLSSIQLN